MRSSKSLVARSDRVYCWPSSHIVAGLYAQSECAETLAYPLRTFAATDASLDRVERGFAVGDGVDHMVRAGGGQLRVSVLETRGLLG